MSSNDLSDALEAYLSQPVDDTDWDRARDELDHQLAKALTSGDEFDRRIAAAIRILEGRIEARRASVRDRN
jgi:hypothetical protein